MIWWVAAVKLRPNGAANEKLVLPATTRNDAKLPCFNKSSYKNKKKRETSKEKINEIQFGQDQMNDKASNERQNRANAGLLGYRGLRAGDGPTWILLRFIGRPHPFLGGSVYFYARKWALFGAVRIWSALTRQSSEMRRLPPVQMTRPRASC